MFQVQLNAFYRVPGLVLSGLLITLSLLGSTVAQQAGTPVIAARAELSEVIEEIPLTGTVISARRARLSTEISGLIETLRVDVGNRVQAGDEILRLDAELEQLSMRAKQAETEQARRELADARRRLKDAERLGRNKTISANEIASLAAEVQIDSAVVQRLQAEEQQQALRVRQHTLQAPFAGVISDKLVEQGEWVQPGEPVVELVTIGELVIEYQVPQSVYTRLGDVTAVKVRFDAFPQTIHDARIETVVPVTDRASRTFLVRTRLLDNDIELIPGLSASAVMHIRKAESGVVIDRNALIRYPDGRVTVWVVALNDDRATVSERQVRTGLSFNGRINIREGLQPGETVVINGNESLREGQAVELKQVLE